MPAAVEEPLVRPISVSKRARSAALPSPALNSAGTPTNSFEKTEHGEDEEERRVRLRREARNITNSIGVPPESFTRGQASMAAPSSSNGASTGAVPANTAQSLSRSRRGSIPDAASRELLQTPQPQRQRQLRASTTTARTTRSARKRAFDEIEDDVSPRSGSVLSEGPPSTRLETPVPTQQGATANASNLNSRAGTPGPKAKKPRVGPRVKTSPVKRKTGTSAGVPRASGERGSPVANGTVNNQDDNDDYCASCGGSGDLVCCDGCTRSFHFNCVDPPLQENSDLPDEWFCNVCISRRNPASLTRYTGLFGALLNIMEKRNSSAFRLPTETREYFEGVKTGIDGEYEEVVVPGTNRTRRRGYEETPDFFRIRDADGNVVLCHICSHSAEENRPIIPCAYCGLWWHIDCLDPPMANPPVLRNWRCPAHADDLLTHLPMKLGPAHRFRKIKGVPVIKTAYSRGMVNNGLIEFASSDDDSDNNNSGWKDLKTFGRVQRVSSKSVELDFLEKIRNDRGKGRRRHERINRRQERLQSRADTSMTATTIAPAPPAQSILLPDRHFIDEAQAAHNLSALATTGQQKLDRSGELINALLSQADANVISLMAQGSSLNIERGSESLNIEDRVALQAMRARIDQLLGNFAASNSPSSAERVPTPDASTVTNGDDNSSGGGKVASSDSGNIPEVAMEDVHVVDGAEKEQGANERKLPNKSISGLGRNTVLMLGEADETNEGNEANEVMSLVSDNGDSDMNEDEDPPPITTPLNAALNGEDSASAAVWPIEHHGSSGSGSEPGSEPGSANASVLPASGKDVNLTENFLLPGTATTKAIRTTTTPSGGTRALQKQTGLPPSPLTPPPTSEVAVEDDCENKENRDRKKTSSEQPPATTGGCGKTT